VTADKQLRAKRRGEQSRSELAELRGRQTEEPAELKELRRDGRQTEQDRYRQR
jgi:hypothetical protein